MTEALHSRLVTYQWYLYSAGFQNPITLNFTVSLPILRRVKNSMILPRDLPNFMSYNFFANVRFS
jgi:hypothetical protein